MSYSENDEEGNRRQVVAFIDFLIDMFDIKPCELYTDECLADAALERQPLRN
jgi:hypothetical protein